MISISYMVKKHFKNGFTLLEVMIAITILTIGIGGSYVLIQQTLRGGNIAESKLIAYYLAQEGIEITRNIRDNNWLLKRGSDVKWDEGIYRNGDDENICYEGCEVDYLSQELNPISGDGNYLRIDSANGFYNYDEGIQTKFKRKIFVSQESEIGVTDEILNIRCEVWWQVGILSQKVQVEENLYNWTDL